jgi:hypothetical protein
VGGACLTGSQTGTSTCQGATAADVADAEAAIARFNSRASSLADTEALARLLLRAEAVASSHIEGLVVGSRRLLRAEAADVLGGTTMDVTAAEVLGNIDAMEITVGRRNRAWEATDVIDAFADFERALASPTGDTRSADPARRVPARRQRS